MPSGEASSRPQPVPQGQEVGSDPSDAKDRPLPLSPSPRTGSRLGARPNTLEFFDLSIGWSRYAVGDFDPAQHRVELDVAGVVLVLARDTHGFPYVFITPNAAPPIDMQLTVSGAPFTGTISVASE